MKPAALYSVKKFTPGRTRLSEILQLLSRRQPRLSLERGRAQLWSVDLQQTGFTVALAPLDTLWFLFWEEELAAVEGDFSRAHLQDMKVAFCHKFGEGVSTWSNELSNALVEIDEAGRCYFRVACNVLFEKYSSTLVNQLALEREKHIRAVVTDI